MIIDDKFTEEYFKVRNRLVEMNNGLAILIERYMEEVLTETSEFDFYTGLHNINVFTYSVGFDCEAVNKYDYDEIQPCSFTLPFSYFEFPDEYIAKHLKSHEDSKVAKQKECEDYERKNKLALLEKLKKELGV